MFHHLGWLLPIFLLFSCAHSAPESLIPSHPIAAHCSILSPAGELLWSYPANFCSYFPDGRFAAGNDQDLAVYSPGGKVLWRKFIPVHHMINQTAEGDLLVLSSEWRPVKNLHFRRFFEVDSDSGKEMIHARMPAQWRKNKFRVDRLLRINQNGKILAEKKINGDFFSPPTLLLIIGPDKMGKWLEASHFNSIYEIPSNSSPLPAFRAGNIIVNDTLNHAVAILDKNLNKVLWRITYVELGYHNAHDVQVLPNGNLLFFVNSRMNQLTESSLDEVNPVERKVVSSVKEPGGFFARYMGSVQKLKNGNLFYSTTENRKTMAKIADPDGNVLWTLDLSRHFPVSVQGTYEQSSLKDFLSRTTQP